MILRFATHACGTRFELVLGGGEGRGAGLEQVGPEQERLERELRAVGSAVLELVEEVDRTWSLFRRDSFLAHLHRRAASGPVRLDEDAFELLRDALAVWRESGGAFDPALAPRQRARGLHVDSELGEAVATDDAPGAEALELDPVARTVAFAEPGVALDLGGIAKGHALALAARELRAAGVERAFLHGGTSAVVALGAPPDRNGWRVALDGGHVDVRDAALAVSGGAGRLAPDGSGHVLGPRGVPAPRERTALVLAPCPRLADAWATALVAEPALLDRAWPRGWAAAVEDGPAGARRWSLVGDPDACASVQLSDAQLPAEPRLPSAIHAARTRC